MSELLKWAHATVTVCHSKTKDLEDKVKGADILVVAIGQPRLIPGDWIKPGAVVIDCGINSIEDSSKKSGKHNQYKLYKKTMYYCCLKDTVLLEMSVSKRLPREPPS